MADYRFVSNWSIDAPVEAVWREMSDPLKWPGFWTGLNDARLLEPGDADRRGAVYELSFKSFLPYTLTLTATITDIAPPNEMTMEATGELEGVAVFSLQETDGVTSSTLTWTTRTTKAWMNALAPLLRGLFEWNHDVLIRRAGRGLSETLGAPIKHADMSAPPLAVAVAPPVAALLGTLWIARRLLKR